MEYAIYLLIIGAIALIGYSLYDTPKSMGNRLPVEVKFSQKKRYLLYLAPVNIISKLLLTRFKIEDKIRDRLLVGRVTLTSSDFFSLKLIFAVLVFAGIFASGLGNSYPAALGIGPLIGFFLPDIWLQKKIAARKEAIGKILPEMVDLMGLCFDAGLDFTLAIKWLLDKLRPNAVLEELSFILEEIHWGKPRTQALKDMSRRLSIPEISSFVQTLTLAERMGTPVALAFTILSEDMRMHRFHRGERIAMKAPIKILFPLVFFILPVIGIVIGGPIILQFMESGMSKTIGG